MDVNTATATGANSVLFISGSREHTLLSCDIVGEFIKHFRIYIYIYIYTLKVSLILNGCCQSIRFTSFVAIPILD